MAGTRRHQHSHLSPASRRSRGAKSLRRNRRPQRANPCMERSTEVIRHLYKQSRGQLPIIGVGGIFTVEDAWENHTTPVQPFAQAFHLKGELAQAYRERAR